MAALGKTLEQVRQQEYTGENRCLPCTVVNTAIAVVLAGAVAAVWLPAGVAAFVLFGAVIYLRGYLVPGTPELTQRYFPGWLLRAFGKDPVGDRSGAGEGHTLDATDHQGDEPASTETLLTDADVVEECPHEDDLCLTDEFEAVWWRRIRRLRDDRERAVRTLAAALSVDPDKLTVTDRPGAFGVEYEGELAAEWQSEAAFYADLAAEPTLAEWVREWEALGDRRRTELLAGLRAFLDACPTCEADLEQVENVKRSCCTGDVVGVSVSDPYAHKRLIEEREMDYRLFSDPGNGVAEAFGVENDLDGMSGVSEARPAVFLLDGDLTVEYAWVAEEWPDFPDYDEIERHLEAL